MGVRDDGWNLIEARYRLTKHDFGQNPFFITAVEMKDATRNLEPRTLSFQNKREDRPKLFKDLGLFMLPVKNGHYVVLRGEGYVDLPPIKKETVIYKSSLDYVLETSRVGNSEMQHLDFAYATSLIRTFMDDDSLVLTIRGRKYTPEFTFRAGGHEIQTRGVQTEVDAGYEGRHQIVLAEAKNKNQENIIIRQLYYPFRQWSEHTNKVIRLLFFENLEGKYAFWQYRFADQYDYHSIVLERTGIYRVIEDE